MTMLAKLLRSLLGIRERVTRYYYRAVLFSRCARGGDQVIIGPDVWWNFHLVQPDRLSIGDGTVLNGECYINAQGGVSIGRYCHVGKGLTVYSSNHNHRSLVAIPYDDIDILKPVSIGDCVWIGANVSVLPGTTIGDGAVIAMGAVVRGVIPAGAVMAGNPAKPVGTRDMEVFGLLYAQGAFS